MDQFLRANLQVCLTAYLAASGSKESTVAQRAANDWRFFRRLSDPSLTFTVRKYEEVLAWFEANWPEGHAWPSSVPRPSEFLARQAGEGAFFAEVGRA